MAATPSFLRSRRLKSLSTPRSGVVPATARFRNDFITDAYLTKDDEEDEEDDDHLKTATISPVFEAEPVQPAFFKPTKMTSTAGITDALPLQRSATGMNLRSGSSLPPPGSVASATQAALKQGKGRVMAFSELGQQCRDFLGDVPVGIKYLAITGPFGAGWRAQAKKFRAHYASLSAALVSSSGHLAASPVSLGESSVDPALLSLSALSLDRQNFMILSMMLAHMTDDLVKVYQDFATPKDIFLDIRRWNSDSLSAEVPLLMSQLRDAVMRPDERVDEFFRRVRGYCSDLRSARSPVSQDYAMGIIIGGIRMACFDSLRLKFGMMRQREIPVDYCSIDLQAGLIPLPPVISGGLHRTKLDDELAFRESLSDDLDEWAGS
eukprot:gene8606-biopygen15521